MSRIRMESITCPGCAREEEFKTYSSLNVTLNPEGKPRLTSRDLFQFKCPGCGLVTDIVYPMLYHDMNQHLMMYLVPDAPDGTPQAPPQAVDPSMVSHMLAEGYRFRCVGSQNELVEKMLIFDAGLEDGPIELVKLALRQKLPPEQAAPQTGVYFSKVIAAEPPRLEFTVVTLDRGGTAEVPKEPIYRTMETAWRRIAPGPQQAGQWLRIDRLFVLEAFEALQRLTP
jgi:hypothetical protein